MGRRRQNIPQYDPRQPDPCGVRTRTQSHDTPHESGDETDYYEVYTKSHRHAQRHRRTQHAQHRTRRNTRDNRQGDMLGCSRRATRGQLPSKHARQTRTEAGYTPSNGERKSPTPKTSKPPTTQTVRDQEGECHRNNRTQRVPGRVDPAGNRTVTKRGKGEQLQRHTVPQMGQEATTPQSARGEAARPNHEVGPRAARLQHHSVSIHERGHQAHQTTQRARAHHFEKQEPRAASPQRHPAENPQERGQSSRTATQTTTTHNPQRTEPGAAEEGV